MTTTTTHTSTTLAREPCAGCGAPLGADQRYCLSCGVPRAGTRLPFLDVLHAEASAAGVVEHDSRPAALLRMPALTPTAAGGAWGAADGAGGTGGRGALLARLRENGGLFALLGVLLLALLIGLLLGHWVSGGARPLATAPAKEIVEIKGLQGLATAPAASTGSAAAGTSEAEATNASGTASGATHAGSTGSSSKANGSSAASTAGKHASSPTVNQLATSTGKEHAQAVEKALSKGGGTLSTGGAPPPKETPKSGSSSAPIGGGSEVATIE